MKHQVYKITNEVNKKVYIGKHSGDIIEDDYWGSGIALTSAIKKYDKENFERIVLKEFDDEQEAYEYERSLVTEQFTISTNTYNLIPGGIGFSSGEAHPYKGKKFSDEHRQKISKNHAKYWEGKKKPPISDETRLKKSVNNARYWKGKTRPDFAGENHPCKRPEVREKISKNSAKVWLGKKRPEMTEWLLENHPNRKAVYQIDKKTDDILNEYESAAAAARAVPGAYACSITKVLKGDLKSTCGYKWKYVNKDYE